MRISKWGFHVVGIVGALGLWEIITQGAHLVPVSTFPAPNVVFGEVGAILRRGYDGTTLGEDIRVSVEAVLIGWFIGVIIGTPLGLIMGWNRAIKEFASPIVEALRPIPPPAWIPFAVLWFGIAPSGRYFVVAISAVMPCIIASYSAVQYADYSVVEAAQCLGASRKLILWRVVAPMQFREIMAGIRVALGNAWMTIVAAELVASSAGLGFILIQAQDSVQTSVVLVSMILIGIVGSLLSLAMLLIESRVVRWS